MNPATQGRGQGVGIERVDRGRIGRGQAHLKCGIDRSGRIACGIADDSRQGVIVAMHQGLHCRTANRNLPCIAADAAIETLTIKRERHGLSVWRTTAGAFNRPTASGLYQLQFCGIEYVVNIQCNACTLGQVGIESQCWQCRVDDHAAADLGGVARQVIHADRDGAGWRVGRNLQSQKAHLPGT